ncbi:MAG TPA: hypothetical protein VML35_09040 [Gaiellaceae bacterium]|nr:hypothetical protein [Gaiellaceae bacterium]
MNVVPYVIPDTPPAELLAELDEAARRVDELSARAVVLTLDMDEQARSLRIQVGENGDVRSLTPRQLFDLLDPA